LDMLISVYEDLYDEVAGKFEGDLVARGLLLDLINTKLAELWDERGASVMDAALAGGDDLV